MTNEAIFEKILKKKGINIIKEYKFLPNRKYRFDYAIPELKIAIEIEGGLYVYGRHNRPKGYINDLEKYNLATLNGWRMLRFPSINTMKTSDFDMIEELYQQQIKIYGKPSSNQIFQDGVYKDEE